MKKRRILIEILAILLIITAFSVKYLNTYYKCTDQDALTSTEKVVIKEISEGYFFDGPTDDIALIFYPGGQVDELAYCSMLKEIAKEYDCFLIKEPFHLAIIDYDKGYDIIENYQYDSYYIGGHSLGGVCASMTLAKHQDDFDGLILLASYSQEDISQLDVDVICIYGENDGVLDKEKYQERKSYLPDNYQEIVITGGNHCNFGNYGFQDGDNQATIDADLQQTICAECVKEFMEN